MVGYSQFQFGSSQDEDDLIGSENLFESSRQFPGEHVLNNTKE
jgi:hypothetical protein